MKQITKFILYLLIATAIIELLDCCNTYKHMAIVHPSHTYWLRDKLVVFDTSGKVVTIRGKEFYNHKK